jgi:putative oxidoreductase
MAQLRNLPDGGLVLAARLSMAAFFLRAGQTKVNGFELSSSAVYLFQEEYQVPLLAPEVAAWLAIGAEHLFPILLIVGLATRLSALALLGMTAVIQVFVYPGSWPDHLMWAVLLMLIAARGPGLFALDALFCKNRQASTT